MSLPLSDYQFAWFSRLNRLRANWVASPLQGEGESEGLLQTPNPSPHPFPFG